MSKEYVSYMKSLVQNDKETIILGEYQEALSLFAEETKDTKRKIIVTLDWRDTAGKWSNIRRVTEYFNLGRFGVKAFTWIPTADEKRKFNWFQRYMNYFPEEWQTRFFDRSWYNRVGVEAAMWFCTEEEYNWFMENVIDFEKTHIIDQEYDFLKIYLSITKKTQKRRLEERENPTTRWKSSDIDAQAQEKWSYYRLAKQRMLEQTDSKHAPWMIIDGNKKYLSAIEIIKAMINTSTEVAWIVENNLSIDLSPDKNLVRTASEELAKMKKNWEIPSKLDGFNFRKPT